MTTHENNQDYRIQDPLQVALFKAAKIGNIKLIKEFIEAGASPFIRDASNYCAIEYAIKYAMKSDAAHTDTFLMELTKLVDNFKKRHN
jgi:ankyrin repeat protein